jgi:hypothetical protein
MFTHSRIVFFALCSFLIAVNVNVSSSSPQATKLVCKKSVLAAWKPIPKLRYSCGGSNDESDEKMLKSPARVRAIKLLVAQLETLDSSAWWQSSPDDLNVCDFRRKVGTLSQQERERFDADYALPLFGDSHIRIAVLADPCFQTQYSGANVFILYRKGTRVFGTEVIDGFFSRAEDAVNVDFAKLGPEDVIEVSTGTGGLHPELTNYYFTIDPKSNRARPKNLFPGDKGPTNQITSALLMSDPEDVGLPADAVALKVIDKHKLAQSFSIYSEVFEGGKIDDNGRTLNRTVLKWDGRMYK